MTKDVSTFINETFWETQVAFVIAAKPAVVCLVPNLPKEVEKSQRGDKS